MVKVIKKAINDINIWIFDLVISKKAVVSFYKKSKMAVEAARTYLELMGLMMNILLIIIWNYNLIVTAFYFILLLSY